MLSVENFIKRSGPNQNLEKVRWGGVKISEEQMTKFNISRGIRFVIVTRYFTFSYYI